MKVFADFRGKSSETLEVTPPEFRKKVRISYFKVL